MKSIATRAPTFFGYIISVLTNVSKSYIKHENTQTIQQHTYHQKIHVNVNAPSNRISTHNVGHICRKIIDGLRDKSFGSVIEKM